MGKPLPYGTVGQRWGSPGDRGNDRQGVPLGNRRRALLEVPHVLVVAIDVDERAQPPRVVVEVLAQPAVARNEAVERVADGAAGDLDARGPIRVRAKRSRQQDLGHGLLLRGVDDELFPLERPAIFGKDEGADLAGRAGGDSQDDVVEQRRAVLPVVFGRAGRMIRMRVIEAEHLDALAIRLLLEPRVLERIDRIAPPAFLRARVLDPLDTGDAGGCDVSRAKEGAAAFLRIGDPPVLADLAESGGVERDHGSSQKGSERYLPPPSQRTVTIVAGPSVISRATFSAATTLAAADGPTRTPSSRARRRHIAKAASVEISRLASASVGS